MRYSLGLVIVLQFCFSPGTQSQELKDTLFCNNASVFVGKVKSISLGIITFKPDDANEVRVQLRKLKTVHTTSRLYRLETVQHAVYYAHLVPADEPGFVRLIGPIDSPKIWLRGITGLMPLEQSFF